jgi:phosphoribosyl 1,2-cyclic phosphodiesterase
MMKLRFYGTRGSVPTSGNGVVYGGNTSCLEVITKKGEEYIFDAGTGIRDLGGVMGWSNYKPAEDGKAKIFLSHLHWDHIQGLPFFTPAYIPSNNITIYAEKNTTKTLRELLSGQMTSPYFPVPMDIQKGIKDFVEITPQRMVFGDVAVGCFNGNHPNGSMIYAMREGNRKIVYATDYEPDGILFGNKLGSIDERLVNFAKGADVLIFDGQYSPQEYIPDKKAFNSVLESIAKEAPEMNYAERRSKFMSLLPKSKIGWGHSTYEIGVDIAVAANAKKLVLTHHDPSHNDTQIDKMLQDAKKYLSEKYPASKMEVEMAYDSMTIEL